MDIRPRPRHAILVGALAAIGATAWATNDAMPPSGDPAAGITARDLVEIQSDEVAPPSRHEVRLDDSLSPREAIVSEDEVIEEREAVEPAASEDTPAPSEEPAVAPVEKPAVAPRRAVKPAPVKKRGVPATHFVVAAPVEERSTTLPGIIVQERRLPEDERIQAQVMDKLASNPRLVGRIAVEARNSEVWLSGYTATAGQAWHAARDAGSVVGVRYVHNWIRPRVGGSV